MPPINLRVVNSSRANAGAIPKFPKENVGTHAYCSVTAQLFSASSLPDDEPPPEQPPAMMPASRVQRLPTW